MTLDEAIKHAEEVAEENNKCAENIRDKMKSEIALSNATECETCADEHRQLAEWLKDYKRLLEQESSEEISGELKKRVFYEIVEPKEMVAKELGCKTQWDCIQWLWTLDILQKHGFAICRTEGFLDD